MQPTVLSTFDLPKIRPPKGMFQRCAWTGSGLDNLQDPCDFFGSGVDLDVYFWKEFVRTGSGYFFDIYNERSLRVIQDVTNYGGRVFFAMVCIKKSKWFCHYVQHSSQSMIIRATYRTFFPAKWK